MHWKWQSAVYMNIRHTDWQRLLWTVKLSYSVDQMELSQERNMTTAVTAKSRSSLPVPELLYSRHLHRLYSAHKFCPKNFWNSRCVPVWWILQLFHCSFLDKNKGVKNFLHYTNHRSVASKKGKRSSFMRHRSWGPNSGPPICFCTACVKSHILCHTVSPDITKYVFFISSVFGCTYHCEQLSIMINVEPRNMTPLNDDHLVGNTRIATGKLKLILKDYSSNNSVKYHMASLLNKALV